MAIPSSPPVLPAELLSPSSPALPPLPSISNRKRRHSGYDSLSSDPVFSEDASDAELCQPRLKKQVRGPWWALRRYGKSRRENLREKRKIHVNDSGVWMHSDEEPRSDGTSSLSSDAEVPSPRAQLFQHIGNVPSTPTNMEDRVAASIRRALDNAHEIIDLDSAGLTALTDAMLQPLHQLIRPPQQKGQYRPLIPDIQLYLASNKLSSLPAELFRLTNLTVLSLRNNKLQRIAPAISRLAKLRELNISGNEVRYLPWEFLAMLRSMQHITYRPNPLYTVTPGLLHNQLQTRFTQTRQMARRQPGSDTGYLYVYLGASKPTYHTIAGKSMAKTLPTHTIVITEDTVQGPASTNPAPSLFELALRRTQKSHALKDVITLLAELPPDDVPETICSALETAAQSQDIGNDVCSTCGREMILSRAVWIEYWSRTPIDEEHLSDDSLLPLLKRACSPGCAVPTCHGTYHR